VQEGGALARRIDAGDRAGPLAGDVVDHGVLEEDLLAPDAALIAAQEGLAPLAVLDRLDEGRGAGRAAPGADQAAQVILREDVDELGGVVVGHRL
jgi:hypothetical protein